MAKLYTLDNKLLTEMPEIRIGEKIYPVDNRQKTVAKLMEASKDLKDGESIEVVRPMLDLAFGPKAAAEIDAMDMPFPAYQKLVELVLAAVTGEDPARFQTADNGRPSV